jgi:allophanate hydrolase
MPDSVLPLTVAEWIDAWRGGASVHGLLGGHVARVRATTPAAAWILAPEPRALAARLDALAAEAAAAGDRTRLLEQRPLFGVPFAVKDNIDVAGWPTTAACPAFAYTPAKDATVVRRLLDAGAVLLGKTNLDQFATGLVGTRSPFGAPACTFDAAHVSGGSSSGSAVATARGDVAFALGTDTAGSGRVPAGFNNVVGLKPTPGRVPTTGVVPACRSLDCVSVFALTVDDAAAVLAAIEGPDDEDHYACFAPGAEALPAGAPRIGVPARPRLDAGYDAAWSEALERARSLGARIVEIDFEPLHEIARLLYEGPWVAERLHAAREVLERDPKAMDPIVAAIIARGTRYDAAETFAAQYALQHGRVLAQRIWQAADALLVPTAPRHPTFAEVAADPVGANAALGAYTNFVNLLGWAALALPSGFTEAGLPFGVTLIGRGGSDAALARWGRAWQQRSALPLGATGRAWTPLPPAAARVPASAPVLRIAVVGAHLSGLPLNGQLVERGATLEATARTSAAYRLYELPGAQPPKPGLVRAAEGGAPIEVEIWRLPASEVGSFVALIPPPLGIGSIELDDGSRVHGFLCESSALAGARDITEHGGWRAWLACR